MGTRHMIAVVNEGKYRVAQYGQWDGYPSGQGVNILKFLINGNVDALKTNSLKCSFISESNYTDLVKDYENSVSEFFKQYPQFNRDTGSDILELVANADSGLQLWDDYKFAADSLFCEWAYVIDFDKNTFEVYEGFNQQSLSPNERFFGLFCEQNVIRKEPYYPVKHKATFSLSDLPTEEEFLLKTEPPDADEDEGGGDNNG